MERIDEIAFALSREGEGEGRALPAQVGERRIARICWNEHGWTRPSGRQGKTKSDHSFEGNTGYGHEEWLFDWENVHEGWQYGFVQGIKEGHEGQVFDLLLYTIHSPTRSRYWVGVIEGVEVITHEDALSAARRMDKSGKLERMRASIVAFGLKPKTIRAHEKNHVVNVRFRQAKTQVFDEPVHFQTKELPMGRYILQHPGVTHERLYQPGRSRDKLVKWNVNTSIVNRTTYANVVKIDPVHAKWQKSLEVTVAQDLPGAKADKEFHIDGHAVDFVIERDGIRAFIEIKTDPSPRKVIRAALAQLMEYAYWPNERRCQVLLIAGSLPAGEDDEDFLKMLRQDFKIPVHYVHIEDGRIAKLAQIWPELVKVYRVGQEGL